ncbi:MAG: DUF3313 domain-containing protein [Colwellia sp.]|nr:DUF3313 domain-containing protein [Colwellia sp.]
MTINNKLLSITIFVFSVVLSGCASNLNQVQSGFLSDYSKLKASKDYDNTKVFQATGFDQTTLAAVKEIKLVPFEIWIKPSSKNDVVLLNTQRLQELSRYFHDKLKQALQNDYQLVDVASPNTLTIQGAFSNIKLSAPELSVTDFIPLRLVLNAGNAAYLQVTNQQDVITEVSIEVEFLLGETAKRVFAMTATKQMELTMGQSGDDGFKVVSEVLDTWIANFVTKLADTRQTTT